MKTSEKKFLIVLIIISIVILVILYMIRENDKEEVKEETNQIEEEYVNKLEDGTRINTSDKLHETKTIDGLTISNFQLTEKENMTILLGTITNNTEETKGGYPVDIKIIDENGNEIITVGGYIGELEPGENMQLNSSASFDYANAYDFEITKK